MIGFFVGILGVFGLVKLMRGGYRHGRHFQHGGCNRASYHHHAEAHRKERGLHGPVRFFLRGAFNRLGTSLAQERAITESVREFKLAMENARDAMKQTPRGVMESFGTDEIDEASLDALFADQDEAIVKARAQLRQALRTVHETLDVEQREHLLKWMGQRVRSGRPFEEGPYR